MKEIIIAGISAIFSFSEEVEEIFGGKQSLNVSYMELSCSIKPWKKGAVRTPGAESGVLSCSAPSWLSYLRMEPRFEQLTVSLTGKTLN